MAVGDVNGDGLADIVTGTGAGGSSRVRVYDSFGSIKKEFKAYTTGTVQAPVKVTLKNIGGTVDIFTSQSNNGSSRQIRGFNPLTGAQVDAFLETDPSFVGGILLGYRRLVGKIYFTAPGINDAGGPLDIHQDLVTELT